MPKTLRVFISSTAEDLKAYRAATIAIVDRLGHKSVHMETFGAMAAASLDACRRVVADCDALVAIVGHRYGWVPPVEQGGDGRTSITWYEVEAARTAGVPVFAFLVDEQTPWAAAQEQDRLLTAKSPAEAAAILEAVQGLQALKAELRRFPCDSFTSPEDLAAKVSTSLSSWLVGVRPPHVESGWWLHPQLGLRLPVPEGWRALEMMNTPSLLAPDAEDGFADNLNVQTLPLAEGMDAHALLQQNAYQLQVQFGLTIDAGDVVTVDGRPAALMHYHGRFPGQARDLRHVCLIVPRGDRQIVITASISLGTWPARAALIEDILARTTFKPLEVAKRGAAS